MILGGHTASKDPQENMMILETKDLEAEFPTFNSVHTEVSPPLSRKEEETVK